MLREQHRLGVYENMVVNEIFGLKWKKNKKKEICIMRDFMICTSHTIVIG